MNNYIKELPKNIKQNLIRILEKNESCIEKLDFEFPIPDSYIIDTGGPYIYQSVRRKYEFNIKLVLTEEEVKFLGFMR